MSTRTAVATWYCIRGSNDTYFRVDMPARAIGAAVCKIPYDTGRQELSEPGLVDRTFRWFLTDDGAEYPDHEGAAVFTRPDQVRLAHALAMMANGVRAVAEVDDNYMAPLNQNEHLHANWTGRNQREHLASLGGFDALIFATARLRDFYVKAFDKERRRSKRVCLAERHVCGNHVDPDDWPERIESDRLRVGWMGGPSHRKDLVLAYPALRWAWEHGHEIRLIGLKPENTPFDYTWTPWIDPKEYERRAFPLDIALAPLLDNRFNLGKSDVKFLEYTLSGAATVASPTVYGDTIVHGETGFIAKTPVEMARWVQELCLFETLRERVAGAAAQYVREERLIGQHADEWRDAVCPA